MSSSATTPRTRIRVGYFGDGPWAHDALSRMLADSSIEIGFVVARHENPDQTLRQMADESGIPFMTNARVNENEFLSVLRRFQCDLFVSMSFNQIMRRPLFAMPPMGTINCHAGQLPFYRGRNVLNWALINDASEFGVTVHFIDEGIDTGDIILQQTFQITDADDYATLLTRAYEACGKLVHEAVTALRAGTASRTRQSDIHPVGFYCSSRRAGDERLDWHQSSRAIFNFVRALSKPGPEARTWLGDNEIRINRVVLVANAPHYIGIPGAVLSKDSLGFLVKTADSFVQVVEVTTPVNIRVGDRLA